MNLLVIDGYLRRKRDVEAGDLEQILGAIEVSAERVRDRMPKLFSEFVYYQFQFYQSRDSYQASELARWIWREAADSRFEKPALIYLGEVVLSQLGQVVAPNVRHGMLADGIRVYARLCELYGTDDASLMSSVNGQLAFFRLAKLRMAIWDLGSADASATRLTALFPRNRDFIALSARTKTKLGELSGARPLWRKLAQGVEPGSELWLEAKYYLAVCLVTQDPKQALMLIRQTKKLAPEMPSQWAEAFANFESQLG